MTTVPLALTNARAGVDRAFRLAENYQEIYEHDLYEPMDINLYEQMIQAARILAHLHHRIYDNWQRAGGTSYAAVNPPGLYAVSAEECTCCAREGEPLCVVCEQAAQSNPIIFTEG